MAIRPMELTLILITSLVGILFIVYWPRLVATKDMSKVTIENVMQEELITLSLGNNEANVHAVEVIVTGYIDGKATIYRYYDDGQVYKDYKIRGRVYKNIGGEYYSRQLKLKYVPTNVKSGNLLIKYKFHTI